MDPERELKLIRLCREEHVRRDRRDEKRGETAKFRTRRRRCLDMRRFVRVW